MKSAIGYLGGRIGKRCLCYLQLATTPWTSQRKFQKRTEWRPGSTDPTEDFWGHGLGRFRQLEKLSQGNLGGKVFLARGQLLKFFLLLSK